MSSFRWESPRVYILIIVLIGIAYNVSMRFSMLLTYNDAWASWNDIGLSFQQVVNGSIYGTEYGFDTSFLDEEGALEKEFAQFRQRDLELDIHSANKSWSSCLIIMDENARLSEWLSYHMFSLPLRHVVVSNDPRSQTDPNVIFDKFRRLGMKIEVWNDEDFGFTQDWRAAEQNGINSMTNVHRKRQAAFYKECALHLKRNDRAWTTFHDADEFIVLDKHYINDTDTRLRQPGSVMKWFQETRQNKPEGIHPMYWEKNCITLSRTMYGTHPSSVAEVQKDVPAFLNASKFETLAYRHHEGHHTGGVNGIVKSIFDVRMAERRQRYGVHVLLKDKMCGAGSIPQGPLAIHHYVGSWEYFSYRDDSRGERRYYWQKKANAAKIRNDDEIRPWIGGFVEYVGKSLARYLLADVGYLAPLPNRQ